MMDSTNISNGLRFTAYGIQTVTIEGEAKLITELDDATLCYEWANLNKENNRLYAANENFALAGVVLCCVCQE